MNSYNILYVLGEKKFRNIIEKQQVKKQVVFRRCYGYNENNVMIQTYKYDSEQT